MDRTDEQGSLDKNGSMTLQSGVVMALSQAQWNTIQQSDSPANLPFHHHESPLSGDVKFIRGDVNVSSGDDKRTSGDQSGDFLGKIEEPHACDNNNVDDAWEWKPLPNLSSLSREELLQYRKSLKERKKTINSQSRSKGIRIQYETQLHFIDDELEKLFHLLKWRPSSYQILKSMSDGELKKRHKELNHVRLNKTYSITDHARAGHEMDKIQSLLDERKPRNLSNQDTQNHNPDSCDLAYSNQKGGNEKKSINHDETKSMDEEKEMEDIYQGVEAYLKFLRRTKRIKGK